MQICALLAADPSPRWLKLLRCQSDSPSQHCRHRQQHQQHPQFEGTFHDNRCSIPTQSMQRDSTNCQESGSCTPTEMVTSLLLLLMTMTVVLPTRRKRTGLAVVVRRFRSHLVAHSHSRFLPLLLLLLLLMWAVPLHHWKHARHRWPVACLSSLVVVFCT